MNHAESKVDAGLNVDPKRLLVGITIAVIAARAYYAWIMSAGPRLQVWFATNPVLVLTILSVSALLGASCAGLAAQRWLGHRLVVPMAILGGAVSTAMVNGLVGACVGAVVGPFVLSRRLRANSLAMGRTTLSEFGSCFTVAIIGGAAANHLGHEPHVTKSMVGAGILIVAALVAVILALGFRASRTSGKALWRSANVMYVIGLLPVLLVGLRVGVEMHRWWQVRQLNRVGYVVGELPQGLNLEWILGKKLCVYPTDITLDSRATAKDLLRLRYFTNSIHALYVEESQISAAEFQTAPALPNLLWVWFNECTIDDAGIANIVTGSRVTTLSLIGTNVSDGSLPLIAKLPIQSLLLREVKRTQPDAFRQLSRCRTMDWLRLDSVGLVDSEAASLAALPAMRVLSVKDNHLTGTFLNAFSQYPSLKSLQLSDNPLDDHHLKQLMRSQIVHVEIDGIPMTDGGWRAIAQMRSLQELSVCRSGDNGRRMANVLRTLPDLKSIRFDGLAIDANVVDLGLETIRFHVADRTLRRDRIHRLSALASMADKVRGVNAFVELERCQLDTDATVEILSSPIRLFTLRRCDYDERFKEALAGHVVLQ